MSPNSSNIFFADTLPDFFVQCFLKLLNCFSPSNLCAILTEAPTSPASIFTANSTISQSSCASSEIVKRKPSFIVLEDLNVSGMIKNKHLSKAVQQQSFYEFRRQIEYKCDWYNIDLVMADRFFPSSKLCSCCGGIKKDLKLSNRIYKCQCGNTIDRDYQASLNLMRYGERELEKQSIA